MKHKVFIIGLSVLAVLLMIRGYFKLSKIDNNGPVISFSNDEVVYTDGEDYKNLLKGGSAIDKEDGDVTDTLTVEKVYTDETKNQAVVTYAAVDKKNNLSKVNRVVFYNAIDSGVPTQTPEPTQTPRASQTPQASSSMVLGSSPILYLKKQTITIKLGDDFTLKKFIAHIVDDKDKEENLYKNVQEKGVFDINTRGTYEMLLSVTDSDGNESNVESVTLVVE